MSCYSDCSFPLQSLGLFSSLKTLSLGGFNFNATTMTSRFHNKWEIWTNLEKLVIYGSSLPLHFLGSLSSLKILHLSPYDDFNDNIFMSDFCELRNLQELFISGNGLKGFTLTGPRPRSRNHSVLSIVKAAMEVGSFSPVEKRIWVCSVMEALLAETLVLAGKSLVCLLMLTGSVLNDMNASLNLTAVDQRFPFGELLKREHPGPENKDGSDTENDDEDEEDNVDDQDDDEDDEDFSAEEGEEGDPEDDPEANGNGGSGEEDDEDDDGDDDDDEDDDAEDEEEEDEEDEDDEVPQPPSKKRK
ncbi:hypothetical protein V6N13_118695 [Hibiscus sabdariffa]